MRSTDPLANEVRQITDSFSSDILVLFHRNTCGGLCLDCIFRNQRLAILARTRARSVFWVLHATMIPKWCRACANGHIVASFSRQQPEIALFFPLLLTDLAFFMGRWRSSTRAILQKGSSPPLSCLDVTVCGRVSRQERHIRYEKSAESPGENTSSL